MLCLLCKCTKLHLPIDIRLELFVTGVMLCAGEVWGVEKADILQRLHLKFPKYALKVKTSTCNNMTYVEL